MDRFQILKKKGVSCVGTYKDGKQIFVGIEHGAAKSIVPMEIEGKALTIQVVGKIRALQGPDRTKRKRPCPGGYSVGHYAVTAGTLGLPVLADGKACILSNNHVLANSNDALLGDSIYQPGAYDGGTADDTIGQLSAFGPIVFGGPTPPPPEGPCGVAKLVADLANLASRAVGSGWRLMPILQGEGENLVDCALAECNQEDLEPGILDYGVPPGFGKGFLLEAVKKSGRNGQTIGAIEFIDLAVKVSYGGGLEATFVEQLGIIPGMLFPGDSGSVILDQNSNEVVGLGFAGSTELSIANPIQAVQDAVGPFDILR